MAVPQGPTCAVGYFTHRWGYVNPLFDMPTYVVVHGTWQRTTLPGGSLRGIAARWEAACARCWVLRCCCVRFSDCCCRCPTGLQAANPTCTAATRLPSWWTISTLAVLPQVLPLSDRGNCFTDVATPFSRCTNSLMMHHNMAAKPPCKLMNMYSSRCTHNNTLVIRTAGQRANSFC